MSRYSPQVKPTSAPSGLAQALQSGIAGFQRERDRMEGQQDRARKRTIETDTLASQGLMPNLPETPETFGSAFTRALSGAPEPQPQAVVPRAFLPREGKFEDVDPITGLPARAMRLPSGGVYNPAVMEGRTAGMELAKGRVDNTLKGEARAQRTQELTPLVASIPGAPVAAASSESAFADWAGRPPQERGLRLGDPGYAKAMADVAAERYAVTGGGQNRPPTEVESKDYIFAGLMEDSMDSIREFSPSVRPEVITAIRVDPVGLAKMALTDDEQLFVQAVRQFTAAALRKESGAAIQPFEISDMYDRYVDTGFDRPRLRTQKAKSRENYLNLLRRTSARARNYYDRVSGAEPSAPVAPKSAPKKEDFMPPEND